LGGREQNRESAIALAQPSPRESRVRVPGREHAEGALILHAAVGEADAESLARRLRAPSPDVELQRTGGEGRLRVRAAASPSGESRL
jgi:hypothetical protein